MTPMMLQYFSIKEKHKDSILFFRLGDFYEMFYDDAELVSSLLDLTLTARNAGEGKKAPLCGIPYHSASTYISKLVELGYSVAICEQVEDPSKTKDIVKREVVKIITKGTLTDPNMLDEDTNNYIACVYKNGSDYALVYADLSTFEIEATSFRSVRELNSELLSIRPSELLVESTLETKELGNFLIKKLETKYYSESNASSTITIFKSFHYLQNSLHKNIKIALGALLSYVIETQLIDIKTKFKFNLYSRENYLLIDENSKRNLELFETIRDSNPKGSLEWVLNHTVTKMGSRLLKSYIRKPLCDIDSINERLDFVEYFYHNDYYRNAIREELGKIKDVERLISKMTYSHIMPKELLSLANSLRSVPVLNSIIKESKYQNFDEMKEHRTLFDRIINTIDEDTKTTLKDGGVIKKGVNGELDELIDIQENASSYLLKIETDLKRSTGIKNLRIKYNKVFGYFIEVTRSNLHLVPDYFIRKQTLVGSERYFTEELKEIELKVVSAKDKRIALENQIYTELVEYVSTFSSEIIDVAKTVATIDVLTNFSLVSKNNNYVRPVMTKDNKIDIKEGRHAVIEKMIGRSEFIANDLSIDAASDQFFIITGPNMAGKSTFLRQVALISVIAQMGCFVPATKARLSVLDKIFTRVGASDNLSQGESTFMVEMNELSYILSNATNNSLVILDEIGRGTSTYDGLSIAWSVVEYLTSDDLHPMSIFATHYHELTEIEEKIPRVKNYRISIKEYKGDLIFLRKIVPGRAMQSYGIEAAKLAGLPSKLINRAKDILKSLDDNDIIYLKDKERVEGAKDHRLLLEYIEELDVNNITPVEALVKLNEIKRMAKDE